MPTFEFKCPDCDQYFDRFCKIADREEVIHEGCEHTAKQVVRTPAKPIWSSLAMGDSASPEAINKFEKMHKQQADKENKAIADHGSIK